MTNYCYVHTLHLQVVPRSFACSRQLVQTITNNYGEKFESDSEPMWSAGQARSRQRQQRWSATLTVSH